MTRIGRPVQAVFASGMIALGILGLCFGDFALVWQPVPSAVPGREALAYISAALMLLCGVGLLRRHTAEWSARILVFYLLAWVALLKIPPVFAAPLTESNWLGLGEIAVLFAGGWALFAELMGARRGSNLNFATGENGMCAAKYLFAVALLPVGLSHIVYVEQTAALVPAWLPYRVGWAYLTGAGHIAAGLGVLLSIYPRRAALMEAAMLTTFTALVWIPAVVAAPAARLPWTGLVISWAISAGAWTVAASIDVQQ